MARHTAGPWFRKSKNTWYVTQDGRNVSLGVQGKGNRKAAMIAWQMLIREGPKVKAEPAAKPETVSDAITGFLADAAARTKPSTHALDKRHLDSLAVKLGTVPVSTLTAVALAAHKR